MFSDHKVGAYITGYTEDNRLEQDAQGLGYHRTKIGGMLGVEIALKGGQFVGGVALSAGRAHISPTGPAPRYHEDIIREDLYLRHSSRIVAQKKSEEARQPRRAVVK